MNAYYSDGGVVWLEAYGERFMLHGSYSREKGEHVAQVILTSVASDCGRAYAEGRKDEAGERKAGQGVRCREMADEVLGELEGIGTGWNEDDIDRIQGTLLPRVYDLLHLLAIASGQEQTTAAPICAAPDLNPCYCRGVCKRETRGPAQ